MEVGKEVSRMGVEPLVEGVARPVVLKEGGGFIVVAGGRGR